MHVYTQRQLERGLWIDRRLLFCCLFEGSLRQHSFNSTLSKGGGRFDTHSRALIYISGGLADPHTQAHSSGFHTLLKHKLRAGFRQLWLAWCICRLSHSCTSKNTCASTQSKSAHTDRSGSRTDTCTLQMKFDSLFDPVLRTYTQNLF